LVDLIIPRRKQKIVYSRKITCKHLTPMGDISNSLQPLCYCAERDLVLAKKAYICSVCNKYIQATKKFSEVYEESRREAEKKIKEKKIELEEYELAELKHEDEMDLSLDEFEEEEDEVAPSKFEKRKVGKDELEDFGDIECPFCGEVVGDIRTHIGECEFAPEDVDIKDILPSKSRKKKKKKPGTTTGGAAKEKQICPYCGKEFIRLGRHLNSCPKKPKDTDENKGVAEKK
jgi:predicted RNA-binding Zn-ribbon protein involved in translation (DUF1610 family)